MYMVVPAISRTLFHPVKRKRSEQNPNFCLPASPWQPPLYFVSLNLTTPGTSHQWNPIVFVFCDGLISLCITCSRFIHVVLCVRIFFIFKPKVLLFIHTIFVYPFIYQWTLGLFLLLAYCEQYNYNTYKYLFMTLLSIHLVYTQKYNCQIIW